jgi:hypothetical protein
LVHEEEAPSAVIAVPVKPLPKRPLALLSINVKHGMDICTEETDVIAISTTVCISEPDLGSIQYFTLFYATPFHKSHLEFI